MRNVVQMDIIRSLEAYFHFKLYPVHNNNVNWENDEKRSKRAKNHNHKRIIITIIGNNNDDNNDYDKRTILDYICL